MAISLCLVKLTVCTRLRHCRSARRSVRVGDLFLHPPPSPDASLSATWVGHCRHIWRMQHVTRSSATEDGRALRPPRASATNPDASLSARKAAPRFTRWRKICLRLRPGRERMKKKVMEYSRATREGLTEKSHRPVMAD